MPECYEDYACYECQVLFEGMCARNTKSQSLQMCCEYQGYYEERGRGICQGVGYFDSARMYIGLCICYLRDVQNINTLARERLVIMINNRHLLWGSSSKPELLGGIAVGPQLALVPGDCLHAPLRRDVRRVQFGQGYLEVGQKPFILYRSDVFRALLNDVSDLCTLPI